MEAGICLFLNLLPFVSRIKSFISWSLFDCFLCVIMLLNDSLVSCNLIIKCIHLSIRVHWRTSWSPIWALCSMEHFPCSSLNLLVACKACVSHVSRFIVNEFGHSLIRVCNVLKRSVHWYGLSRLAIFWFLRIFSCCALKLLSTACRSASASTACASWSLSSFCHL